MFASELIARLASLIHLHGDETVRFTTTHSTEAGERAWMTVQAEPTSQVHDQQDYVVDQFFTIGIAEDELV